MFLGGGGGGGDINETRFVWHILLPSCRAGFCFLLRGTAAEASSSGHIYSSSIPLTDGLFACYTDRWLRGSELAAARFCVLIGTGRPPFCACVRSLAYLFINPEDSVPYDACPGPEQLLYRSLSLMIYMPDLLYFYISFVDIYIIAV